jgi:phosphoribosylamine--glycine ligase
MNLVDGTDSLELEHNSIAIGVVLSVPDYPYSHLTRKEVVGIPVYHADELTEHLHPAEMMLCEAPGLKGGHEKMLGTAGDYVLVMTATGPTVRSAQQLTYKRLKTLVVPNSPMWRTDIGDRLRKELPLLQKHGYAKGMSYQQTPASSTASQTRPSTPSKPASMNIGQMQIIYV